MTSLPGTIQERLMLPRSARTGRGDEGPSLTPADVFAMLRRRLVLAIVLFVVLSGLLGAGFVVWWIYFPGFRSESLIECVSNVPSAGLTLEHERLRQEEHERFVATQALLIKSQAILGEVLKINSVRATSWYRRVIDRKDEPLLELTDDLVATPVRGTNFLRVSLESRVAEDPAIIINEVVRQWLDTVKRRSSEEFAGDLQAAQTEREALDRRIESNRQELQAIATRLPPGVRQDPGNNLASLEARELAEQAARLRLERDQLEQLRAIYNNPEGIAATADDRALVEQDPVVAQMRQTLLLLEQQRAADLMRYGRNHTVYRTATAQIMAVEEKLGQLLSQRLAEIQAKNREDVNTAYENTQHALFLVEDRIERADAVLADQDRLLFDYTNIEAEITEDVARRQKLSDYITDLDRVVRQRSAISVSIAQQATDPLQRSSPSLLLIPLAVFIAAGLAVGLSLGLEFLDKSVRTSQDIVRYLDVAMLGAVPHTDDEEVAIERVETAVQDAPKSMVAEAFRQIRTNLQFSAPAARQKSILITSPRPADGKTSVAANLAIAVAQGGRRVLLVDANFRRPGLNAIFTPALGKGLSNVLVGDGAWDAHIQSTAVPGLDVLYSGPTPPNPAELVGGEPFRAFIQSAGQRYDQVFVDSPPVLVATDPLVMASAMDGVILVVRAKENTRGVARRAAILLADVGAHMFGAVLNAAQITRGGYFREQLRTYYDYQDSSPPTLPTPGGKK